LPPGHVPLEVHHVNGDPIDSRIVNTIPPRRDCHHAATFPGISGLTTRPGSSSYSQPDL
jgi:hypothetical protein